jgi:aspartate/tyrosine/aromatic aminotransferase
MKMLRLVPQKLDKIMALNQVFRGDKNPNKVNLIIGAYRTRQGKPYIFESVKQAKTILNKDFKDYEYLPIEGDNEYLKHSKNLYFANKNTHYDNVQTLSGTGSLKLAADFLAQSYNENHNTVYLPNPTWGNHSNIFASSGLSTSIYTYLDKNRNFNIELLIDSIKKIPDNNIILLHACAHNPSGYDPSQIEWENIIKLCKSKNLFILIDFAYLGFASGIPNQDSYVLEIMNREKYPSLVCCSYAKNFGLYSERVGNLFFSGQTDEDTSMIKDMLKSIIRRTYSNPPANGSNIIKTILGSNELSNIWKNELYEIGQHYIENRKMLKNKLENSLNKDFSDVVKQTGMFYYSKLTSPQVLQLREKGIYFPDDGRISLAGITQDNVDFVVKSWSELK